MEVSKGLFFKWTRSRNEELDPKEARHDVNENEEEDNLIPMIKDLSSLEVLIDKGVPELSFSAITTSQELYSPGDDVHVMIVSLSNARKTVTLTYSRNGIKWFSDKVILDSRGLGLHVLNGVDLGQYDVSAHVTDDVTDEPVMLVGITSFEVAIHDISPLTVRIIEQEVDATGRIVTIDFLARILGIPYNGIMEISMYCSFCGERMTVEVTCVNGKGKAVFDLKDHADPSNLRFSIKSSGHGVQLPLEGITMQGRTKISMSRNLTRDRAMLLFPQRKSVSIQGINLVWGRKNPNSPFRVHTILSETIPLELLEDMKLLGMTVIDVVTGDVQSRILKTVEKGRIIHIANPNSHQLVLLGGIVNEQLVEAFFVAFKPFKDPPILKTSSTAMAGDTIEIQVTNPKSESVGCFLLVHDLRKTHHSLREALGREVHSQLVHLGELEIIFDETYYPENPRMKKALDIQVCQPFDGEPCIGDGNFYLKEEARLETLYPYHDKRVDNFDDLDDSLTRSDHVLEHFPDVVKCLLFTLEPEETKSITLTLGDQETTWAVRLQAFHSLQFIETVHYIKATRTRSIELDAPRILDEELGDRVDVEVLCKTDTNGVLSVFLNDLELIKDVQVRPGLTNFPVSVEKTGVLRAVLVTDKERVEIKKEIQKPFLQTRITERLIYLFPKDHFVPTHPVTIHPSPLFLLEKTIEGLIQYPFGCAEQLSAKIGALVIGYTYLHQMKDMRKKNVAFFILEGLRNLKSYFSFGGLFRLWEHEFSSSKVTVQVLKNLVPLQEFIVKAEKTSRSSSDPFFSLITNSHLYPDIREMLSKSAKKLLELGVTSFDLIPYSIQFRPREVSTDVGVVAKNLIYDEDASIKQKKKWLRLIKVAAREEKDSCWWNSSITWAGKLETTAIVLRALAKNRSHMSTSLQVLYQKGFSYIGKNLINGRLFSTTDTFALINLLTELPAGNPRIKIMDDSWMKVTKSITIQDPFVTKSHVIVSWTEEQLASPFDHLPNDGLEASVTVDRRKVHLGETITLYIHLPSDAFCVAVSVCLPPQLAHLKGGGNVQQCYFPLERNRESKMVLTAVRRGHGHVRVVLHEMYDPEKTYKAKPILIEVH